MPLYEQYWADLDSGYWRKHEDPSDESLPRIDVFLRHWLVARTMSEVPTDHLYPAFRDYLAADGRRVEPVLADLAADARLYASLDSLPLGSTPERFRYRVVQTLDLGTMNTLLLRLLRWQEHGLPAEQRDAVLTAVESWAVRRALCRIAQKDTLRVVVDLLRAFERADPATAGTVAERVLARDDGSPAGCGRRTSCSPDRWRTPRSTSRSSRSASDAARGDRGPSAHRPDRAPPLPAQPDRGAHHAPRLAHYWSASLPAPGAAGQRDKLVDSIGNLTLLTTELNKTTANRPWTDAEARGLNLGKTGKRSEILRTSRLAMNADLVAAHPESWAEADIRRRTEALVAAAIEILAPATAPRRRPAPGHRRGRRPRGRRGRGRHRARGRGHPRPRARGGAAGVQPQVRGGHHIPAGAVGGHAPAHVRRTRGRARVPARAHRPGAPAVLDEPEVRAGQGHRGRRLPGHRRRGRQRGAHVHPGQGRPGRHPPRRGHRDHRRHHRRGPRRPARPRRKATRAGGGGHSI